MENTLREKLLTPTQSYNSFEEWEKDFTDNYLKNNPTKTKDHLMFDRGYNRVRNITYNRFIALKNGNEYIEQESDASKSYWTWRDNYDRTMSIHNDGKSPEQIINEAMEETRSRIQTENILEKQQSQNKIEALRAIFNACNPRPSDKFRKD